VCQRSRHIVQLALCLIVLLARASAAQIPALPSQQIPRAHRTPPPITGQPAEVPNAPFTLPAPQGSTREIPLPEVFRGCWSGSVAEIDSLQLFNPDAGRLIWLTKTYTLCYKQTGYSGKWQLTFAESGVADPLRVSEQRQLIKVNSVSGGDRAELTAYLHFRTNGFVGFGGIARPSTLDELSHLHCSISPERELMVVSAAVFVESNGEPYANLSWHTDFSRIGG